MFSRRRLPIGTKNNLTRLFFFSDFSGTAGISEQNPGIRGQKSLISLVSRDMPNFLAPTPSHSHKRPPPQQKRSGLKSLGLGAFFFVPDSKRFTLYMGKTGTIWQFFRALFPSTWRTLSPDALFTRIWDTTQTPRICHIFVLSLLVSRSSFP